MEEDYFKEIENRVSKVVTRFRKIAKYVKILLKQRKIENFYAMAKSNYRDTIHISLDMKTHWNSHHTQIFQNISPSSTELLGGRRQ